MNTVAETTLSGGISSTAMSVASNSGVAIGDKVIMEKIPGGKTRIASYAAALWLVKEDWEQRSEEELLSEGMTDLDVDFLHYMREARNRKFTNFINDLKQISNEEAPANSAGGGAIAGMGVNGPSDVKLSRNVRKPMRRRKRRIA